MPEFISIFWAYVDAGTTANAFVMNSQTLFGSATEEIPSAPIPGGLETPPFDAREHSVHYYELNCLT
jgi:hypothetical protein